MLRFKSLGQISPLFKQTSILLSKWNQSNNIPRLVLVRSNYTTKPNESTITREHVTKSTELTTHEQVTKSTESLTDEPWYLKLGQDQRDILKSQQEGIIKETIQYPITLKPSSTLMNITNYLNDKLGLSNTIIFDMKNIDHNQINGKIGDIIILTTALSMKHCHNSYIELNQLLKSNYNNLPTVEGKLNNHELKKLQRRLKRKNVKAPSDSGFGIDGSRHEINEAWYMIDCKIDGIIVNILTEKKRNELNLEELYAPIEEKYKYKKIEETKVEHMGLQTGEQSILAGLKRLANQRRNYSTSTVQLKGEIVSPEILKSSRIWRKDHILATLKSSISKLDTGTNPQDSLTALSLMINTLNDLPIEKTKTIKVFQWKQTLDSIWPLILPTNSTLFWSKRFEFLTLLHTIKPNTFQTSRFVKSYFIHKRLSNNKLTRKELIDFLKLNIIEVNKNKGRNLMTVNTVISQVLPLYEDNTLDLATDVELINLLFQTLVNNQETKLNSLYSVIDYILMETSNTPDTRVIIPMLRSLAQAKKWSEYFNLWSNKLYGIEIGKDYRPWEQFIQYIVDSNDQHLQYQLIKDGHLLWLLRYKVNITPGIKKQITALFNKLDPQREHSKDLESLLLNTNKSL